MRRKQANRSDAAARRQCGMGLVMIIGVVAALAISAATVVAFAGNVQHNSSDTRMHTKSFAVCEAGLDAGMALLSRSWPVSAAAVPTFDTAAFRAQFPTSEFPNPASGPFIVVGWYDDLTPANTTVRHDSNDNGKLWMVSQANVGARSTRVLSLVERTWFTMQLPRGIPLWAGGNVSSAGTQPKILVDVPPPQGTVTTIHVGGTISLSGGGNNASLTQPGIAQQTGASISPLAEVFPQSLVDALKATAQANGRYFTSKAAAESSPANPVWSPQGGLSGLCVIEPATPTTLILGGNTVLNSVAQPGILVVLGGSTLDWRGTAAYYGVIYCAGPADFSRGTADIHGMVIVNSNYELAGTPRLRYNDDCIARLDQRFPSVARRVPNTWREVQPL